jgi:perosamine synthetase
MDVKDLKIQSDQKIKSALELLNTTGLGILFVTGKNDLLLGIITDGDVRRALLDGKQLTSYINDIMNVDYISLPLGTDNGIVLETITNEVKIIPLVDSMGKLVDYASINKIRRISVASPLLNGNELAYVTDCIKSSWISSQGKYVREFEKVFKDYHGGMPALAVSNGTVALHLALDALGITEGDEVLVADLTFAASVNSIIYTGATPVLIDIEMDTWNIDLKKAEEKLTANTKAIMPVHLYGHPCDMDEIVAFAKKYNLLIIEDCAEALGSYYKGKPVGIFGDASTYSFFGNKTITTGEGGMVVFKNPEVAGKAEMLRDHGMQKTKRYWHSKVGYNYRLTNIQAAIGVAQFERLEEFLAAKRHIAQTYNQTLTTYKFFQIPAEKKDTKNSYWLYTFLVNESAPFSRDELIEYLMNQGIETRPVFFPMHQMPPYVNYGNPHDLEISIRVSKCGMSLPSSANLTENELAHICREINNFVKKFND